MVRSVVTSLSIPIRFSDDRPLASHTLSKTLAGAYNGRNSVRQQRKVVSQGTTRTVQVLTAGTEMLVSRQHWWTKCFFADPPRHCTDRMPSTAGRVTIPNQPAFLAYGNDGDWTTTSGSRIAFDSTHHNVGNGYSTSPISSQHRLRVDISLADKCGQRSMALWLGGTSSITEHIVDSLVPTLLLKAANTGATILSLAASDYVTMVVDNANVTLTLAHRTSASFMATLSANSQENTHAGYHRISHRHREQALEYAAVSVKTGPTTPSLTVPIAKDEIIEKLVKHCNSNGITIATGEDAQVTQAFDLDVVDTAANVQAAAEAAAAAMASGE